MPQWSIEEVVDKHAGRWMEVTGVAGAGVGQDDGEPVIIILTSESEDVMRQRLPGSQDGYRLVFRQTGPFNPLD